MRLILLSLITSTFLLGSDKNNIVHIDSFREASKMYSVELRLLLAIGKTESNFVTDAENVNTDGSMDRGIMQINDFWIKHLKKYTSGNIAAALYNADYNIKVGAWVLKDCTNRFGESWKAVDCYNKGASKAQNGSAYINKVYANYQLMPSI